MRILFLFSALLISALSFGQSERYQINLNIPNYEPTKTVVKDHIAHQYTCGTYNDNGTIRFWAAKMTGSTVVWAKSVAAYESWSYMDISPLEMVESTDANVYFIARGNQLGNYTARVMKLSGSNGNVIWSKEITTEPGSYFQKAYENNPVIPTSDGIIFSMAGADHLQITKIDLAGNLVYSKQLKIQGVTPMDSPGHLFIPDNFGGYLAGFENGNGVVVVGLTNSLDVLWSTKVLAGVNAKIRSICHSPSGRIFIGGEIPNTSKAFAAKLDNKGGVMDFREFTDSDAISIDQLFDYDSQTLLASTRTGYLLIDKDAWTYDEFLVKNATFNMFGNLNDRWTYGSTWNLDYHLDFDPAHPDCIAYTGPVNHTATAVSASDSLIPCSVIDMGTLIPYTPIGFTALPLTLVNDCFVSVKEETLPDFSLYPNPVSAEGTLSFSGATVPGQSGTVIFSDLQGKTVSTTAFKQEMQLPRLSPGVYFVQIGDQNQLSAPQKLIIE